MTDLAEEAAAQAADAAGRAHVRITDLEEVGYLRAASGLLDTIWGREASAGSVLAPEALIALSHAGGQVTGALREGELIGVTAAFVGLSPGGAVHLHSHITGVVPTAAGRGVGRALKLHQRAWCLARGVGTVRWTFDPLVRRNAVFNLVVLGAQAVAFERDVYGPMADARNRGLPTDRLLTDWDLTGPRARAALAGRPAEPDVASVRRAGAEVAVDVGEDDEPRVTPTDAPRRLVRVPPDIEAIRDRDRELAERWSAAARDQLGAAMEAGMRVTGVTRDGWYLLAGAGGVHELAERR